jgi:type I restriction enzyme R subunit
MDKRDLSEIDICDLFITPNIQRAGWDPFTQIRREVTLTPGPVVVRGNVASRNKKKKKFADYVLYKELGVPVAVVEAKDNHHSVGLGLQQALDYSAILNVPCAFSSNGDAFASHNKTARPPEDIETQFPLHRFPPPAILWERYKTHRGIKDAAERLTLQPYYEDASGKEARYYQAEAINRTVEAVAVGQRRVLLGDRDGQDLYDLPDYLAPVEGRSRQAGVVSRGSKHPRRPDADQRLQAFWSRDVESDRTQVRSGL